LSAWWERYYNLITCNVVHFPHVKIHLVSSI
jgi:hypothetical protein